MEIIRDTENFYLKKLRIPEQIFDQFETILVIYDEGDTLPIINLNKNDKVICGNYAYEDYNKLKPFNDWKRSGISKELKPNIIKKIDLISHDQRKVYYDILELNVESIYDFNISFISNGNIDWFNLNFLIQNYYSRNLSYYLTILKNTRLIIQQGHNEQYRQDVKIYTYRKNDPILSFDAPVTNEYFEHYFNYILHRRSFHY